MQISFVINFDTMDIKILDENGQDLFERPLEDIIDFVKEEDQETTEPPLYESLPESPTNACFVHAP